MLTRGACAAAALATAVLLMGPAAHADGGGPVVVDTDNHDQSVRTTVTAPGAAGHRIGKCVRRLLITQPSQSDLHLLRSGR